MWPPSSHTNFFSSLKQVEKRLKSENSSRPSTLSSPPGLPPPPPPLESNYASTESLSSPIYLNLGQPNNSLTLQDSEPPQAFLSNSPEFPLTHQDPPQINGLHPPGTTIDVEDDEIDDIERLIQLLGLSDYKEEEKEEENGTGGNSCHCDGGFYAKIVGVKGPKCVKEVERLEGWIKHYSSGGLEGRREPMILAHLLLGKAAFVLGDSAAFGGLEFPSTIEEFLQNDPPYR